GNHQVAVKVTDQDLTEVSVAWTLNVTKDKTLFLSPDGNDNAPGTIDQPKRSFAGWHLDDTSDNTYQGYHVIMRGGDYPWAAMASRNNNIELHQRKPLVFLAYPGEEPVLDMSGGKFIANYSGGTPNGAPDLFVHGLTLKDGDQSRPNAHFFWLTGNTTERVTLFENTFRNLGPGTRGNDNPSVSFVSHTGDRKLYFAYIGNTYDGLKSSGNGVSLFDHYSTDYTIFENNRMVNIESRFGAWTKSDNGWTTFRRNTGTYSPTGIDGGMFVFTPGRGDPQYALVEYCWNYVTMPPSTMMDGRGPTLVMFDWSKRGTGKAWAYRNTLFGKIWSRSAPTDQYPRVAENNVVISPYDTIHRFTDVNNLVGDPGQG
ncbi:MAG: hypothetical protein WD079_03155, partial [Phycisphaeraceae bacterium]